MKHRAPLVAGLLGWLAALPLGAATLAPRGPWTAQDARVSGAASAANETTRRLAPGESIEWTVEVPVAGRYELRLRYRTHERSVAGEMRVNGHARGLGLSAGLGRWLESARRVTLQAGRNVVGFFATDAAFEVAELRLGGAHEAALQPLVEAPEVSPLRVRLDASAPQELRWFVRRAGQGTPELRVGGRPLAARWIDCAALDDAGWLVVPASEWSAGAADAAALELRFPRGAVRAVEIERPGKLDRAPWVIATLDVRHGKCTVLRLPDGSVAMIDTAKAEEFAQTVAPLLRAQGIRRIDHVFITHYHEDHSGGLAALRAEFEVGSVRDYRSFRTGDRFELGGVAVQVLNAYDAGTDENSRSLSLRCEYRGFVFTDGADIYAHNQARILRAEPAAVRAHVYSANHHFHGSVDVAYLRQTDAALFIVSADPAVYARGAFTEEYEPEVAAYLRRSGGRWRETLLTPEVGHVIVRVQDAEHWTYETRRGADGVIAGLGTATR